MTIQTYIWISRATLALITAILAAVLVFIILSASGVAPALIMPLAACKACILTNSVFLMMGTLTTLGLVMVNENVINHRKMVDNKQKSKQKEEPIVVQWNSLVT